MDEEYSLETLYEIWRNADGSYIEVGADRDGLDLIEIRVYEKESHKPIERVLLTKEQARLVAEALNKTIKDQEQNK